jgi:choline dehydrogenase-like flavoprotein
LTDPDFIVVGSGPAGVSVAFPLVAAGARVLMIDGATQEEGVRSPDQPWQKMLGDHLEALSPDVGLSPKLGTPLARRILQEFDRGGLAIGDGFAAIGSRSRGGLSRIWGGLACEFDAADVDNWPFSIDRLRPSYRRVIERIGVSGSSSDELAEFYGNSGTLLPPLPIGPAAASLMARYREGSQGTAFAMGLARNAVLTVDREDRYGCDLRKDCLWGCARGAIYDANSDLAKLLREPGFRLVDSAFAVRLLPAKSGWNVETEDGRTFGARRVVVAAGALSTAALVLPLIPNAPSTLPVLTNPVLAMPLFVPSRAGKSASKRGYSLAQLGYRLSYGHAAHEYVTGSVFEVDGLPAYPFVAKLPFSRKAGTDFLAAAAPAMLIATCNFPGVSSANMLRLVRDGSRSSIIIRGGFSNQLFSKIKEVRARLRAIWRRLGAWELPGTALAQPGADVHYAGPLGMGMNKVQGCSEYGEVNAAPGLFVVDGASLPSLPSKYLTLTIMANADRIGQNLVQRCGV